jgi:hypothetical protein
MEILQLVIGTRIAETGRADIYRKNAFIPFFSSPSAVMCTYLRTVVHYGPMSYRGELRTFRAGVTQTTEQKLAVVCVTFGTDVNIVERRHGWLLNVKRNGRAPQLSP